MGRIFLLTISSLLLIACASSDIKWHNPNASVERYHEDYSTCELMTQSERDSLYIPVNRPSHTGITAELIQHSSDRAVNQYREQRALHECMTAKGYIKVSGAQ